EFVIAETNAAIRRLRHEVRDRSIGNRAGDRAKHAEAARPARQEDELLAVFDFNAFDFPRARAVGGAQKRVARIRRLVGITRLLGGNLLSAQAAVLNVKL